MVLKGLIRYIINKYLKDYIEQLDQEKLKLDFKHGNVSLENLRLKPEALVGLGIPVTVAFGFIEKLSIVISWKSLHSYPTKVHLDGLYMLIVPKNEMKQDLTEFHSDKMRRVQKKLENLRKTMSDEHEIEEKDKGFFEKMKFQIMQNLQITLTNFHLCYETNSTTKLGHPFSFGITIHSLQLITSKNTQKMGKNKENSLVIIEMKGIDHLSIYWNTQCQSRINLSFEYVINELKCQIASNDRIVKRTDMNYILHPVNLNLRLELALKFAERNFQRPILRGIYHLEHILIQMDPKQLSDLIDFVKFQNYSAFYDRCREYRQLYLIESTDHIHLTTEQKDRIKILELKLDIYTLAYIRHTVELDTNQHYDENYSWWNWWWEGNDNANQDNHQKNGDNKEGFSSKELFDMDMNIMVKSMEFDLLSPRNSSTNIESISHVLIDQTQIDYKRRAVSSSTIFTLALKHIEIFGLTTNEQIPRPLLLTSSSKCSHPLMRMEFELAPIDKKCDYRFLLMVEPMTVIYHAETINRIVHNFEPVEKNSFVPNTIRKERTFKQMKDRLAKKQIFDMKIQFQSLTSLIPQFGFYKQNCPLVLVRFNHLLFRSILNEKKEDDENIFQRKLIEREFYQKYNLNCGDLTIIHLRSNGERIDVLKPIPSIDINFYKCIYPDDICLTDWRIVLRISPMIQMNLSEDILREFLVHHETIPLCYSSLTEALYRINLLFSIFPPNVTIESDLGIRKCSLLLNDLKQSIETDVMVFTSKTGTIDEFERALDLKLKSLMMQMNESSQSFYRNDQIQLLYSESDTRL